MPISLRDGRCNRPQRRRRRAFALRAVPAAQVQLSLNVQGVLRDVQQAFYGLCVNAGKQVLAAMMEADRVALCGCGRRLEFVFFQPV